MVCTNNMNVRTILISAQLSASLEINIWRTALHRSINQSIKDKQPEICCAKFFLQHFWLSLTEENMYCMFTCHTDSWHTGVSLKAGFFFYSIDSKLQLLLFKSESEGFSHPQQRQRCRSALRQDAVSGRECDALSTLRAKPGGMFSAGCWKARREQLAQRSMKQDHCCHGNP